MLPSFAGPANCSSTRADPFPPCLLHRRRMRQGIVASHAGLARPSPSWKARCRYERAWLLCRPIAQQMLRPSPLRGCDVPFFLRRKLAGRFPTVVKRLPPRTFTAILASGRKPGEQPRSCWRKKCPCRLQELSARRGRGRGEILPQKTWALTTLPTRHRGPGGRQAQSVLAAPFRYISVTTGKRSFSPNNQTRREKPLSVGLVAAAGKLRGEGGRR